MIRRALVLEPGKDNVANLLETAEAGDCIKTGEREITLLEDVEFAHKVCIVNLRKGDRVIKYGVEIGYMLTDVPAGTWIHNHNMGCDRGKKEVT